MATLIPRRESDQALPEVADPRGRGIEAFGVDLLREGAAVDQRGPNADGVLDGLEFDDGVDALWELFCGVGGWLEELLEEGFYV